MNFFLAVILFKTLSVFFGILKTTGELSNTKLALTEILLRVTKSDPLWLLLISCKTLKFQGSKKQTDHQLLLWCQWFKWIAKTE